MTHLFSPLKLKDITLRNRIGVSPMCQYCYENGIGDDWLLTHLGARAAGGAGLVISEAAAVEARGRISPQDLGIWSDDHIEPLARTTRFIRSQGAVAGIQLAHAGRKACTVRPWDGGGPIPHNDTNWWQAVGPSDIAFSEDHQKPKSLDQQGIREIQKSFGMAASRAYQAGFEWLELHAAHGYLIHNFLSPLSNQRDDQYGGSFENRIRLLLETIEVVRKAWPERYPLTVRISGTDWVDGGWSVEDSVRLARLMKDSGVDLVDCSSGGNVPNVSIPVSPGYQVPISEEIKRKTGLLTAAVGLITNPEQADEIIRKNQADVVLLARAMLREPYWPINAAEKLNQPAPIPPQYLRGF